VNYQDKYEDLLSRYRRLQEKHNKLQAECKKIGDKLDSANLRIEQELEPRIAHEKREYDNWVTNLRG